MYLCFEEYFGRLITFREVKACDAFHMPCANLFVKQDAPEYICDYLNLYREIKNLLFLCSLVCCLMFELGLFLIAKNLESI